MNIKTNSGIPIQNIYENSPDSLQEKLGKPGAYPFTRGVQSDMYRGKLWTMRQYAGFGSAQESNARYRFLLSQGQMGLSVAFDLPTQLGLDPDHNLSTGEVGKAGVSVACLQDMEVLFSEIKLQDISTSMTINATAGILLAFYIAFAKKQGAELSKLQGTVQNDCLKEFAARGNYIYPPQASLKLTTNVIEFCSKELPKWNPISISGYHIREAGSTATQEVAFTFAHAICYIEQVLKKGLLIDDFAPRLSFFWNVHNEFFEEVAKFRAARRIWAKILKEQFGVKKESSLKLRFHAQTAGSSLTAQQPHNNIVRVAYQAMAAVLGGCQSLHTNSYDEAVSLPTEQAARLALRTQQILAYETGVTKTADPLGGSFYIEALTDEIEKKVLEYLKEIHQKGGAMKCIENGFIQAEISSAAYEQQKAIDQKTLAVVGINIFTEQESTKIPVFKISQDLEKNRISEIKKFRSQQDIKKALIGLEKATRLDQNTMPLTISAVESGCTLGEISDIFRKVFGTHL